MEHAIALAVAYLLGSLDFGVLVPRLLGVDIYQVGSGNPGTSNVFRTMGKKAALLVLAGDAAKGLVAVALAEALAGDTTAVAAAFLAVVGHIFPLWHRFKGGKGVATAIGAALWIVPVVGAVLAVLWIGVVAVTKTASLASLGAMVLYVPGFVIGGVRGSRLWWAAAVAALVVIRHRGNIARLISGEERKLEEA